MSENVVLVMREYEAAFIKKMMGVSHGNWSGRVSLTSLYKKLPPVSHVERYMGKIPDWKVEYE